LPKPKCLNALCSRGLAAAILACAAAAGCAGWPGAGSAEPGVKFEGLSTEFRTNPLGLDASTPRLSWKLVSDRRGVMQSAYEIRVARSDRQLEDGADLVWDSDKTASAQSVLQAYAGPALAPRTRYWWQVRVWDEQGAASAWSAPAWWETGLLSPAGWTAQWIEPALTEAAGQDNPPPMLRREFRLKGPVHSARAYITSHGLYEWYLNGARVGDAQFTPGWTSYGKRLAYQSYDVTALLKPGANAAGAVLGDGWYRGSFIKRRNHYGDKLGLLLQIQVVYEDGSEETIASDGGWKSAAGPIRMSEIYAGEDYDARLERPGWSSPGYDDRDWAGVTVADLPKDGIVAVSGPPVRRHEELKPVRIFRTPAGQTVADLGQNMVGWVRLRVQGPAGTVVTLRHAEVLDRDGNFYTENLRSAAQQLRYTLKGGGEEVYEPHFSYQGFRYVAVDGYPGALTPDSLTGIVLHADMAPTGTFETSDPLLNQLQHNIVWGQKGNFVVVPSDCPQRDERLGWTGDAQAFSPTAAFNMDVDGFFSSWLADLAADQNQDGAVPWVVPDLVGSFGGLHAAGAAGWGDAATVIPWNLYVAYGDAGVLAAQYDSMARWVGYERAKAGDKLIWSGGFQFGDWLDYGSAERKNFGATPADLVATAYFAHSADILARTAKVLGKTEDATRYERLFAGIKEAFVLQFAGKDGRVGAGTQTGYVLALDFDLLPEELRPAAAQRLAQAVREAGHLTTGFLGTPHLLQTLSRYGALDVAYQLLERQDFPSWLYPVQHGATTIWERWDGIKPDGSFEDAAMNSFNHYAYGAVGEWMYTTIAGIAPDPALPGYKHLFIRPRPGGGLSHAGASHETPYGRVESAWNVSGGRMSLSLRIPPNTSASVLLPGAALDQVAEAGGMPAGARQEQSGVAVELGSGRYQFSYPAPAAN
jgi:alpha-L-rhamnosidase